MENSAWKSARVDLGHIYQMQIEEQIEILFRSGINNLQELVLENTSILHFQMKFNWYQISDEDHERVWIIPPGQTKILIPPNRRLTLFWQRAESV